MKTYNTYLIFESVACMVTNLIINYINLKKFFEFYLRITYYNVKLAGFRNINKLDIKIRIILQ